MQKSDSFVVVVRDAACIVLMKEAEGLQELALNLPATFETAINLLLHHPGKIVLTGIGKSGHVACKGASTFCSMGLPSFFLHPAEAIHGDLGALSKTDLLILLSNSGETAELFGPLRHALDTKLPHFLITSCPNSSLALLANTVLTLPTVPEACPLGLAPTTSACMMTGLMDALAIVVSQQKGLTEKDYHMLHPGGSLGHHLCAINEIMHRGSALPFVLNTAMMSDAILESSQKGFGCVGIVDRDGLLVGIISDGDLRRHMAPDLLSKSVTSVMTYGPYVLSKETTSREALIFMNQHKITVLFVVDPQGKPEGLIHMHDCLRVLPR